MEFISALCGKSLRKSPNIFHWLIHDNFRLGPVYFYVFAHQDSLEKVTLGKMYLRLKVLLLDLDTSQSV